MLTLGIDTSTEVGSLGLVNEDDFLGEINLYLQHRHSERIIVNIDHLLRETEHKVQDLEGMAVGVGPGSFTGLRIGVTTARTMAQFLEIPITGISTLDILAYNILSSEKKWILPVIDASRKRVYTSLYKYNENDLIIIDKAKIWEEQALTLDELFDKLKEQAGNEKIYITGNGVNNYKNYFQESELNFYFSSIVQNFSRGSVIAELGLNYIKNGKNQNIFELTPNYLKKAQARVDR